MKQELSLNLIFDRQVQKLMDNFASVIHAHVSFFSPDGQLLRQGRDEGNCRFCQLIQRKNLRRCRALDKEKQYLAEQTGCCQTYICHAGLREAVMPVRTGTELLGYVMFGQFRASEHFPGQLMQSGCSAAELSELKNAFRELPLFSEEAMENLTGLMKLLVDYMVRNELITRGRDCLYSVIDSYLEENLSREITLGETARHFGRSVSSFCHFLNARHTTFKKMLTEKRLAYAEKLMRTQHDMPIKEAAMYSGFPDPFYFSRVYKEKRGFPPEEFRRKQQQKG